MKEEGCDFGQSSVNNKRLAASIGVRFDTTAYDHEVPGPHRTSADPSIDAFSMIDQVDTRSKAS